MISQDLVLPARDGFRLAATLFAPERENGIATVINPATAVPRGYYGAFAAWLAERGFTVLTYDYRGIGGSQAPDRPRLDFTFRDWGEKDSPAALDWLLANRPHLAPTIVGHSAGGQMLGLAETIAQVRAIWLIASQHGYWRLWPGPRRWQLALLWYVALPLSVRLLGHFPGRLFGLDYLPAGVARQWARWCRNPHYVSDENGNPLRPYNHLVTAPLHMTGFSDDPIAPPAAVAALQSYYPNAPTTCRLLSPAELGVPRIGHFGWFRRDFPKAEWERAAGWLSRAANGTAGDRPIAAATSAE